MRVTAQTVFVAVFCLLAFIFFRMPAYAQTTYPSYPSSTQTSNNFLFPNTDSNVPENHHTFTQIELMDVLSAAMCQLTGVDPVDPQQPCLGVDPTTGRIGFAATQQQFGTAQNQQPVLGGAVGLLTGYISSMYVPAISTSQYVSYLSSSFGVVKSADAATAAPTNCNINPVGYGLCGLSPILKLWSDVRDFSYAMLTLLFIAIGIGVMLRFRIDARTVMTLQNQIPRVVIAILLITFSFAIAGAMIDIMWTATYAGVNFISQAAPNSKIAVNCPKPPTNINQNVEQRLIDNPISFTNTVFRADCKGGFDNGFLDLADKVAASLGDLVTQIVHDMLFTQNTCHASWLQWALIVPGLLKTAQCALQNGALDVILWGLELLVKIIIIVTILIALFRLWFQLIKCYLTFLIFVILGPIWIVLGLIPGRPMGFEKWLRIIFANLAVFPLVACLLVFARVIVDTVPATGANLPNTYFTPPLIGNPNLGTFGDLMGFGAILIAPTIPDLIKERLKAKSQANLGAAVGAAIGMGATAFSAPGKRAWESLNRKDQYGRPEGALAVQRAKLVRSMPIVGRRVIARDKTRRQVQEAYTEGDWSKYKTKKQNRADIPTWREQRRGDDSGNGGNTNPTGGGTPPPSRPSTPPPGAVRRSAGWAWNKWKGRRAQQPSAPPAGSPTSTMHPGGGAATQAPAGFAKPPTKPAKVGLIKSILYDQQRTTQPKSVGERATQAGQAVGNAGRAVGRGVHRGVYGSGEDVPEGYKRTLLGGIRKVKTKTPDAPKKDDGK